MKNTFYKTRNNRKYLSIIDEYRRYYVTGKNFTIKEAKGKKLGDVIFQLVVKEILKSIYKNKLIDELDTGYENLYPGIKFKNSRYKQNIHVAEFIKNKLFILQYNDDKKNIYRISIEIKNNNSNKILYSEWVKKSKTFFGLGDTVGKIAMRRGVVSKSKMLKQKITNKLFANAPRKEKEYRDWESSQNMQSKSKGFLARREVTFDDDIGGRFDKEESKKYLSKRQMQGTEQKLMEAEEKVSKKEEDNNDNK